MYVLMDSNVMIDMESSWPNNNQIASIDLNKQLLNKIKTYTYIYIYI